MNLKERKVYMNSIYVPSNLNGENQIFSDLKIISQRNNDENLKKLYFH